MFGMGDGNCAPKTFGKKKTTSNIPTFNKITSMLN